MRFCPACGGAKRRALAPAFFECITPKAPGSQRSVTHLVCGEKFVDTSDEPTSRRRFASLSHVLFG